MKINQTNQWKYNKQINENILNKSMKINETNQ